jgi:hypothetical protein
MQGAVAVLQPIDRVALTAQGLMDAFAQSHVIFNQ